MNAAADAVPAAVSSHTRPGSPYAWYVLAMLVIVYTFNWFDRYLLIITMESIKQDLGISDTALGLLTGFAFSAVYSVSGIFVARWSDLGNRRTIIACGLAVWSGMTAVCGLAQNFMQLAIARFGVGLGEAACSPPAHAMISDYFRLKQRATALAIYGLGLYIGLAGGLAVGGWLNEEYGWRMAFIIAGVPGLILAVIFRLTVREPARGQADTGAVDAARYSVKEVAQFMLSRRSFVAYVIGTGLFVLSGNATDIWGATFLIRVHGLGSAEVGETIGAIGGLAGVAGTMFFALLADRLSRYDLRWYLWVAGIGGVLTVPAILAFLFSPPGTMVYVFYALGVFCGASYMAPTFAITQRLMPLRMRALSSAVILLSYNIIGTAFGNLFTGVISDVLHPLYGVESIRYALAYTALAAVIGGGFLWYGAHRLPADLRAGGVE